MHLRLVALLRKRALSTTEFAAAVKLTQGTVSHRLRVLEGAGLIRVVRTRRVRALIVATLYPSGSKT